MCYYFDIQIICLDSIWENKFFSILLIYYYLYFYIYSFKIKLNFSNTFSYELTATVKKCLH